MLSKRCLLPGLIQLSTNFCLEQSFLAQAEGTPVLLTDLGMIVTIGSLSLPLHCSIHRHRATFLGPRYPLWVERHHRWELWVWINKSSCQQETSVRKPDFFMSIQIRTRETSLDTECSCKSSFHLLCFKDCSLTFLMPMWLRWLNPTGVMLVVETFPNTLTLIRYSLKRKQAEDHYFWKKKLQFFNLN